MGRTGWVVEAYIYKYHLAYMGSSINRQYSVLIHIALCISIFLLAARVVECKLDFYDEDVRVVQRERSEETESVPKNFVPKTSTYEDEDNLLPKDKASHFLAGSAVASFITGLSYPFMTHGDWRINMHAASSIGMLTGLTFGALKEAYDYFDPDAHSVEGMDIFFTGFGACMSSMLSASLIAIAFTVGISPLVTGSILVATGSVLGIYVLFVNI